MSIAALIRQMTDAGAPIEAVLIAVEAIEARQAALDAVEADKAAKRAKDAARKRDARTTDMARTVHGHSTDTARNVQETPPLPPPNDIYSNPPLNPPTKSKPARGSRLPDDWFPKPLPANLAASVAAWPAGKQERELARFRDWAASATGPNAVKNDWDAAWRNWLRKVDDEQGKPANGRQHSRPERSTTRQTGERVAARFAAGSGGAADGLPRLGAPGRHD